MKCILTERNNEYYIVKNHIHYEVTKEAGNVLLALMNSTKTVSRADLSLLCRYDIDVLKKVVDRVMDGSVRTIKISIKQHDREDFCNKHPTATTQPSDALQAERDADWAATCSYTPHLLEEDLAMCPGGCGYGYCAFNKKWYSKEEWTGKYI